jgi:hypothetical protein
MDRPRIRTTKVRAFFFRRLFDLFSWSRFGFFFSPVALDPFANARGEPFATDAE